MVLHKLAYAETNWNVGNIFGVGKTTILKYLMFICNALADKDKLYLQFIAIPIGMRLKDIIRGFHRIIKLPQICGVIDGSHVIQETTHKIYSGILLVSTRCTYNIATKNL